STTTENYTLSLHDALPISTRSAVPGGERGVHADVAMPVPFRSEHDRESAGAVDDGIWAAEAGSSVGTGGGRSLHDCEQPRTVIRSEEHTSELQSLAYLVCR